MSLAPRFILAAAVFLVAGCELQELVARTQQSLLDIADDATAWAEDNADLFGGVESLRNGPGDAARHQYWSCLLAVLYSEDLSRNLTTAWEEASIAHGGPLHESQMDLLNNAEGILLARSITSTGEQARIDCAQAVIDNIMAGSYASLGDGDLVIYPALGLG